MVVYTSTHRDTGRKITIEFKDSLGHIVTLSLVWDTQKTPDSENKKEKCIKNQ